MVIERIVPGTKEWDVFYANHFCRYEFAKIKLEENGSLKIIDIACGVGYGTKYLSAIRNSKIWGADKSSEALTIAKQYFASDNLTFYNDDCDIMLESKKNRPFDSVVSFETIEHLQNPDLFIANCYEILNSRGIMISSTPNANVTSPDGVVHWEFHEKEYSAKEFVELLTKHGFVNIKLYGQQYTKTGRLRLEMAAYFNAINSNPFVRLGRWFQKYIRGKDVKYIVKEEHGDFEIIQYNDTDEIDMLKEKGPFVIIAIGQKNKP